MDLPAAYHGNVILEMSSSYVCVRLSNTVAKRSIASHCVSRTINSISAGRGGAYFASLPTPTRTPRRCAWRWPSSRGGLVRFRQDRDTPSRRRRALSRSQWRRWRLRTSPVRTYRACAVQTCASTRSTSTPTRTMWLPPPRMTPRSGLVSLKSRPQAKVRCSSQGMLPLVGSKST